MMRRTALLSLAILLIAGCKDQSAQEQAKRTQQLLTDTTVPVRVAHSKTMDLTESIEVTGAFTTSEQSSVGPALAGRLVSVYVRDGDTVRAGQAIAQQETQDLLTRLRQAQAQADAARSSLQQAQSDARIAPTKSDSNVRAAQARLSQAQARLNKAKNGSRTEERTQAEWAVKKAKSDMDTAKAALDRANRLYAEGAIAKADVEAADNRYQNSMAGYQGALENLSIVQSATRPEDLQAAAEDVRAAQEAVRLARADQRLDVLYLQRVEGARASLASAQEQVRLAQKALADATIKSPFSGRVSGKPVQPGTFVAPGGVVATIVGGAGTYFEANVPETKVALIRPGSSVDVTVDALGGAQFTGNVIAVNPVASGQGRLFSVRVSILQSATAIKPGMFAAGRIRVGQRMNAVVVPNEAVIRDGEVTYLFTAVGDKAKRFEVKLGLQQGTMVEVSGLASGENVIVSGQSGLVDGAKIKVETDKKGA